jgi:hypothetical protein
VPGRTRPSSDGDQVSRDHPRIEARERTEVLYGRSNHQDVAKLAYLFWEERGRRPLGSPEIDWSRAERELWARGEGAYPVSSFALEPQTGPRREAEVRESAQ